MKKLPLLLSATGFAMLTGCAGFAIFKFDDLPAPRTAERAGATKQAVLAAAGQPQSSIAVPQIHGSCFNYLLRKEADTMAYYVAFNAQDQVVAWGYTISCQEANTAGYLNSSTPPGVKYGPTPQQ